jgi:glyoxylase-like metal-dependent hydrolase (beta-lactamase superfamily II)
VSDVVPFTIVNIGTLSMNKFWGETERVRAPSATCTLLQSGKTRMLVDPSPEPAALEPMLYARTGLHPSAIDAVFLTHWHGDHRYGLASFEGATWWMAAEGLAEWQRRQPGEAALWARFQPAEGTLAAGIALYPSPGHAIGHSSLRVDTAWGPLIVAGDAVMTPEFFAAEEGYHNSVDFDQAAGTIRAIRRDARLVIPGHGNLILNL